MTETELTPEELDALLEFEAGRHERKERKLLILYRLQWVPADDPLWENITRLLEESYASCRLLLESGR